MPMATDDRAVIDDSNRRQMERLGASGSMPMATDGRAVIDDSNRRQMERLGASGSMPMATDGRAVIDDGDRRQMERLGASGSLQMATNGDHIGDRQTMTADHADGDRWPRPADALPIWIIPDGDHIGSTSGRWNGLEFPP